MRSPRRPAGHRADVIIVGAGPIGLTLSVALSAAGLRVAAIDRVDPALAVADGRTTALAAASQRLFAALGVWARLQSGAGPIDDIRVADGESPVHLAFDHRSLGEGPLGWIVENGALRQALLARARRLPGFALFAPADLVGLDRDAERACARLADGTEIRAPLAIAADGRNSWLRREAGIRVTRWDYPHGAIACIATHTRPHGNLAHERFLPSGPFAMLPMRDDAQGRPRTSIVWCEPRDLLPAFLALPRAAFEAELQRRCGDWLGRVTLDGAPFAHPLGLLHAERYVDRRLALAGDSAHAIHPVAGQGFNLGLRGAAVLAEVLVAAHRLGLDLGADSVLADYQRARRVDVLALAAVTDGLVRLFAARALPLRAARNLGLAAVEKIPPLKRFFMRQAMGLASGRARLLAGEAL